LEETLCRTDAIHAQRGDCGVKLRATVSVTEPQNPHDFAYLCNQAYNVEE
jgi:hypothetical protein